MKVLWAVLPVLLLPAPVLGGVAPPVVYRCDRLMSEKLDAAASFVPSVMGEVTLDGKGGYDHVQGGGKVALAESVLRFTSGPMMGTVGMLRKDAKGREYLHIDKSITDPPGASPRALDLVCYRK